MTKHIFKCFLLCCWVLSGCGKTNDPVDAGGGNGNNGGSKDTICLLSAISQSNSGLGAESSLLAYYNSNYQVTRLVQYDSVARVKNFEANFTYATPDSVRIDAYQYLKLDAAKRVARFVTRADLTDPANADRYVFEYLYNTEGYLATKNLFINGSTLPNFKTEYFYNNQLLTGCLMTAVSSGNLKVLESTLTYDNVLKIKNGLYTFPDGVDGYMYLTLLNFGNRPLRPLKEVSTRIYDPVTGRLLDTATTRYGNYKLDVNGYITYGETNGDQQQGMAAFYGKTNFYYSCH